jgi:spore maturation protein CgeB
MNVTILGLSITSSWGNGHATTYRSLVKGLRKRGHRVIFFERDTPWYSSNRDMPDPDFCKVALYHSVDELRIYREIIEKSDLVILGSYVPEGIAVGEWLITTTTGVKAFYDIDTPVTLSALRKNECMYLSPSLVPGFDLYLSFTAGPCLGIFENEYHSPAARKFYCSVDPELYYPVKSDTKWDLGYLGTYSDDRQPALDKLLITPARRWHEGRFVVAGPQYPGSISWPENVRRIEHLPPALHNEFYNSQKFTLNITRKDMVAMGYSPSVRLFEAAACGVPVISDWWEGLDKIFMPGEEILISGGQEDTLKYLKNLTGEERLKIGGRARKVVLEHHTGEKRAIELESYVEEVKKDPERSRRIPSDQDHLR